VNFVLFAVNILSYC